jgi:putative flippase GtrA
MRAALTRGLVSRLCRYGFVGFAGVFVHLGMLSVLVSALGIDYLIATSLAVEAAILHNFVWHERWTWSDRELPTRARLMRLVTFNSTTGLVSILGNLIFMRLLVGSLGLHYLLGGIGSIATCGLVNFLVSDRIVFVAWEASLGRAARE